MREDVTIALMRDGDVALLKRFHGQDNPPSGNYYLKERLKGRCTVLIAWAGELPVGRLFLHWSSGAEGELDRIAAKLPEAAKFLDVPTFNELEVLPDFRGKGIGTALIRRAEELVSERGVSRAGMSVSVTNIRARALYERLGYRDCGLGESSDCGEYVDEDGQVRQFDNVDVFLVKQLTKATSPASRIA